MSDKASSRLSLEGLFFIKRAAPRALEYAAAASAMLTPALRRNSVPLFCHVLYIELYIESLFSTTEAANCFFCLSSQLLSPLPAFFFARRSPLEKPRVCGAFFVRERFKKEGNAHVAFPSWNNELSGGYQAPSWKRSKETTVTVSPSSLPMLATSFSTLMEGSFTNSWLMRQLCL